jgi:hypothetical protein
VTEIPFDRVLLIFNPNSTGDAAGTADQLRLTLESRFPGLPVDLQPTALRPMPLQIDGEVMELDGGDRVRVQIARKVLATIR